MPNYSDWQNNFPDVPCPLSRKKILVQSTNTGAYQEDAHFDLAVPGGGVGET